MGEHFVRATYSFEGDGLLVFSCFEMLSAVNTSIQAVHMHNTHAVVECLSGMPGNTISYQQWLTYPRRCEEGGLIYFQKFTNELSGSVAAFKAARPFLPHKVDEMSLQDYIECWLTLQYNKKKFVYMLSLSMSA